MPLVFYKAEAADRGKVTFVHYNPERLSAQERALGISVDAVPEFDRLSGKSAVLYINPQTGDLWHEYIDIPTTQWVQRNEMIALMEGMSGSGVATESTLVEAVESLEGVEAKVATAAKQDDAKAVLDAIDRNQIAVLIAHQVALDIPHVVFVRRIDKRLHTRRNLVQRRISDRPDPNEAQDTVV